MPLWNVIHPSDAYSADDRRAIAGVVTSMYATFMPRFYVNVLFTEIKPGSLFIGGEPHNRFVRIWVDHIARKVPDDEAAVRLLNKVREILAPWIADRGYDWEFHADETPFRLWSVQGHLPPQAGTDDEIRWRAENRPSARTHP